MTINEELVYTGENFNLVLDNKNHAIQAFGIIKNMLADKLSESNDDDNLSIDEENFKIYLENGNIGNANDCVIELCRAVANGLMDASFYGHAYFDDCCGGYQSCADYTYENGVLRVSVIESPNGNGLCPECGEQIVCFDEFDSSKKYYCEECDFEIEDCADMFDGELPTVRKYEETITQ